MTTPNPPRNRCLLSESILDIRNIFDWVSQRVLRVSGKFCIFLHIRAYILWMFVHIFQTRSVFQGHAYSCIFFAYLSRRPIMISSCQWCITMMITGMTVIFPYLCIFQIAYYCIFCIMILEAFICTLRVYVCTHACHDAACIHVTVCIHLEGWYVTVLYNMVYHTFVM